RNNGSRLAIVSHSRRLVLYAIPQPLSCPHAEEPRLKRVHARLPCTMARRLEARARAAPSFETRARPFELCGSSSMRAPQDEDGRARAELRLVAEPFAVIPISRCQTAHLVPAAHVCVRGVQLRFTHPEIEGWAERRAP